jgi:hypothetical protein
LKYILSLTSHGPRLGSLHEVISKIPNWEVLPEKIILNLAQKDFLLLDKDFQKNCPVDLEIQIVEDFGPATKLIPTLLVYQHLPIVTIDDDIHYSPSLITKVLVEHKIFPNCVISGRAHQITYNDDGDMIPYLEWHGETQVVNGPSKELFPTGVGMILYPQKTLHHDVFDTDTYKNLCFYNDDIWFYFHARRAGTLVRRVPHGMNLNYVANSQSVGRWLENAKRNDVYLKNLTNLYGNPLFM